MISRLVRVALISSVVSLSACLGGGNGGSGLEGSVASNGLSENGIGQSSPSVNVPVPPTGVVDSPALVSNPNIVRFIAMGDSGSGSPGQIATGDAMRQVCKQMGMLNNKPGQSDDFYIHQGCHFVLGFGDNVYEKGVNSSTDSLFFDKFEKAYLTMPADIPFFMALGNHDNTGFLGYASQDQVPGVDTDTSRGDYQVLYTKQAVDSSGANPANPRKTPRWQMPSRYYDFTAGGSPDKPLIHFFAVDAITATSTIPDANGKYSYDGYGQDQLRWLKRGLNNSNAQFKITFAHHPYLSNGQHGNAGAYDGLPNALLPVASGQRYKDFLEEAMCDASDVFMNGHDHDLEWLTAVPSCGRTEFLLSGAAGKNDRDLKQPENNSVRMQHGQRYGFFWVEVRLNPQTGKPQMQADMYSVALNTNGEYSVQPTLIDGKKDGAPLRYRITKEDPQTAVSPTQKVRREAYLKKIGQTRINVLDQKPREYPVFTGIATQPSPGDCQTAVQSKLSSAPSKGPLDPVEQAYKNAVQMAKDRLPGSQAQLLTSLSDAVVRVLDVNDTIAAAVLDASLSKDPLYAQARVQEGYRLAAIKLVRLTADLPSQFKDAGQVAPVFAGLPDSFNKASTRTAASDCRQQDLSAYVAPIAGLSANLANIAEAANQQGGSVPVVGGAVKTLADALNNSTQLFAVTSTARLSLINDRVFASIDQLLRDLVTDVLPLQGNVPAQAPTGFTPVAVEGLALGVLKAAAQEVTYNLERGLKPVTNPLISALSQLAQVLGF